MDKKHYFTPLEVKFAVGEDTYAKTFSGYGAYFGNSDAYGDVILPGAFAKSIARHEADGTMPLMFFNHDARAMPIGRWTKMSEDADGLVVEGELLDTSGGRDAYTAIKAGVVTGLSIGYICRGFELDGKKRTITEAELLEISVVTIPANDLARVTDIKRMEEKMTDDELKAALTEAGFADDAIAALYATREENSNDETEADDASQTKYNEAAIVAALRQAVATIKEINV